MRWLMNALDGLPIIVQLLILVLIFQFGAQFLGAVSWLFLPLAIVFGAIVIGGLLNKLGYLQGAWLMDILDQYSNKKILSAMLKDMPTQNARIIDPDKLKEELKSELFGQDEVCDDVVNQIYRRFAREKREKPIGVFLLVGPPATGKTWFAKVLSKALYGENALAHYEMSHFTEAYSASQLFGQSPGIAGSDRYGRLTGELRITPDRVILLDEFEKAHPDIRTKFLSAWNDGFVTEASTGEKLPTTDAIFILTSNAAEKQIEALTKQQFPSRDALSDACKSALKDVFDPAVLSRIDYIFPFAPAQNMDLARIVLMFLIEDVKAYGMELINVQPHVLAGCVHQANRTKADARGLARDVERMIADRLVALKHQGVKRVQIVIGDNGPEPVPYEEPTKTPPERKSR